MLSTHASFAVAFVHVVVINPVDDGPSPESELEERDPSPHSSLVLDRRTMAPPPRAMNSGVAGHLSSPPAEQRAPEHAGHGLSGRAVRTRAWPRRRARFVHGMPSRSLIAINN